MMFKILVLRTLYNLADEQVEYQIRDRLSFMRFLGLGLEDTVPDATSARGFYVLGGSMADIFISYSKADREGPCAVKNLDGAWPDPSAQNRVGTLLSVDRREGKSCQTTS